MGRLGRLRQNEAIGAVWGKSYLAPTGGAFWAAAQEGDRALFFFGFSTVFSLIFLLVHVFTIFADFPIYWFLFS
jgi:hypothetical protein